MSRTFAESTVVITGASRGIGRRIGLTFAAEPSHALFLIARDSDSLEKVKQECIEVGASAVETASCDLTRAEEGGQLALSGTMPDQGLIMHHAGSSLRR